MSSSGLLATVFCGVAARNGEKQKKIKEDETRVNSRQNASVGPAARLKKIRVTSFRIIADGSTRHASCNATRSGMLKIPFHHLIAIKLSPRINSIASQESQISTR